MNTIPIPENKKRLQGGAGPESPGTACPVCGSSDVWNFAKIHGVPVFSNVLPLSRAQALRVPRGDLHLNGCRDCGHVYNSAFRSIAVDYCTDYENSLFFSGEYRAYASSLAAELVERLDLHGKRVVEIGCGSGDFLKLLCEAGGNVGIGFDPSAVAGRSVDRDPRITFIRDHYSADHAHVDADLVCCRHVLEHIDRPLEFLKGIRKALPEGKNCGFFFEVPNALFILKAHSSWDLIYEHPSYFSRSSLHRLFTVSGFAVREIRGTFHDQFLCVWAETAGDTGEVGGSRFAPAMDKKDVLENARVFGRVLSQQLQTWGRRLQSLDKSEKRVVLWGAGSKGVTFLNLLRGNGSIKAVVDINERKHGKYIPGSGQRIVPPAFLKRYRPDVVILMNPAYEEEVRGKVQEMGLAARILPVNQPAGGGKH